VIIRSAEPRATEGRVVQRHGIDIRKGIRFADGRRQPIECICRLAESRCGGALRSRDFRRPFPALGRE
jgi:hypothetical protein